MSEGLLSLKKNSLPNYLNISRKDLDKILSKPEAFYRKIQIEVKGKSRIICPPKSPLKEIQKTLLRGIYGHVRWLGCLHGGIPKKSVISNARCHLNQYLVTTYDISDFFSSTTDKMIRECFISMNFEPDMADTLTRLVSLNGTLPLGASTSTAIANLVFRASDISLLKLCKKHNLTYTRYVDDIAISGKKDFRDLSQAIRGIIEMLGYKINPRKIKYYFNHQQQVVTGLVVNKVLSPTQSFLKDTKILIHRCRTEGPTIVADEHGFTIQQLRQMISGRIAFIRSVNPKKGRDLRGLLVGISWNDSNLGRH